MSKSRYSFRGPLASEFQKFVEIMKELGKYDSHFWLMRRLDQFLLDRHPNAKTLTKEILSEWFDTFSHLRSVTQIGYRSCIFLLCEFLRSHDGSTATRNQFLSLRRPEFRPYIFSHAEVAHLLKQARAIRPMPRDPLRPMTFELVVALLYSSGLRISEVISLDIADYDETEGVLKIRKTKFGKTRLVPLSESAKSKIETYLKKRRKLKISTIANDALIWSPYNGRPSTKFMKIALMKLMRTAGLKPAHGRQGPRVHDLRHTFAVHRLLAWYRQDADVPQMLPQLSTYLGHVSIESTQHYLRYMPEVLLEANRRFERSFSAMEVQS